MSRNINLCHSDNIQSIDGFSNVTVDNIDSIVNCSVDIIYYRFINRLNSEQLGSVLSKLLQKLRTGGNLVLRMLDIRAIAKSYSDNSIDSQTFLSQISSVNMAITPEEINNGLNSLEYITGKIEYENNHIILSIVRKEIV